MRHCKTFDVSMLGNSLMLKIQILVVSNELLVTFELVRLTTSKFANMSSHMQRLHTKAYQRVRKML